MSENADAEDCITVTFDPLDHIPTEAGSYSAMREMWPVTQVSLAIRRRSWVQAGGSLDPK